MQKVGFHPPSAINNFSLYTSMKKHLILAAIGLFGVSTMNATDLQINGTTYEVDTVIVKHRVGPGTKYAYYRVNNRPLEIHVLEMDLNNPYFNLEVWNGGNAAVACETPTHAGQRYTNAGTDVIAVHNGDFFSTIMGETGISRMGLLGAGEMIFNPTGNVLFCMDNDGVPRIDNVYFGGTVTRTDGSSARLHTVNQLRLEWEPATYADQLSLYTPAFGSKMHVVSSGGTVVTLRPVAGSNIYPANVPLTMEVVAVQDNTEQMEIPVDGSLLHGVGASAAFLNALTPGQTVTLNLGASMPSYPDVITIHDAIGGSGHVILRNGEVLNINNPDVHPRTFMGISQDKKTVYSVIVDGRYSGSAGIDLDDQGRVLKWLGAWDGINLDGGGSTCLVVNGTIRNHPSDGSERAVGNGVIFYSTAPKDDAVADIQFPASDWRLPLGSKITPKITGFNKYDYLVVDSMPDITLTCDPEIGYITDNGRTFVAATTTGSGVLTATSAVGLSTSVTVYIQDIPATADFSNYIIDNRRDYGLQFSAVNGRHTYPVEAAVMTWTVGDEKVATVTDGKVRGVENGTTTLTAVSPQFNGEITVVTENAPLSDELTVFNNTAITAKQTGGKGIAAVPAEGEGFNVTYTGNGTARGAYILLDGKDYAMTTYGLPDALEITINPGEAPVSQIRLNYTDNKGNRSTISLTETALEPNKQVTLTKSFADLFDVTDNSYYPITFSGLRFEMGTSEKDKDFVISVPSFVYRYDGKAAVNDITSDNTSVVKGDSNSLYRVDGTKVLTPNVAPGLYIKGDGTKILVK